MAEEKTCPHCGKPVPPTAPGGICPECMLKAGLVAQTEGPGATGPNGTKVVKPPPSLAEIAALFPQLEIIECLGRGGMGVVYKARQPRLNRLVALKILARDKEQDAQFAERFAREAQALARLNHPNIVTVHDFGEVGGHCYLVMEFVDGLSLRQLLLAGKMPPEQALAIVPKICDALQYAHEQGIVHRDIKPENILLDKQGRVKIADFGIAKMLGDEAGRQTLTGAKDVVGTPHYMAPEQIEKPQRVDHRADIYSLGVVFYEMLTGELPLGKFAAPSQKVQIDVRLDEVILHALEKEPERRYQQVGQVKTAVETIATTPPTGRSAPADAPWRDRGVDYRSQTTLFGLPLVHVATGIDPATGRKRRAKGIIAIGDIAQGVVAFGGIAMGGLAFGGIALGGFAFGGCAIGLVALGGLAMALMAALGGGAIAPIALGAGAIGYLAYCGIGGIGSGVGVHVLDAVTNDPVAERFFLPWAKELMADAQYINWFLLLLTFGIGIGVPLWLRRRAVNKPAKATPEGHVLPASTLFSRLMIQFVAFGGVMLIVCLVLLLGMSSEAIGAKTWSYFRLGFEVLAASCFAGFLFIVYRAITTKTPEARQAVKSAVPWMIVMLLGIFFGFWSPHLLSIKSDYIGQADFPKGDSIEITSVERTHERMVVKGHYSLVSHDNASLTLYITSKNRGQVPEDASQRMEISKGEGDFELTDPYLMAALPGWPHVSMYADGGSFAALYFGTKAEALEESKLPKGYSLSKGSSTAATPASAELEFRLVAAEDDTRTPADELADPNDRTGQTKLRVLKEVLLDSSAVANASLGTNQHPSDAKTMSIMLKNDAVQKFSELTAANFGRKLAIVWRGRVLSAPAIRAKITGPAVEVTGKLSDAEWQVLLDLLNFKSGPSAPNQTIKHPEVSTVLPADEDRTLSFGPVIERVLTFNSQKLTDCLDLDSGEIVTRPSELEWQGIPFPDALPAGVSIYFREDSCISSTGGTVITTLLREQWETLSPVEAFHDASKILGSPLVTGASARANELPKVFFFRTGKGNVGLLQVVGFAYKPRGVKIRYKLVQTNPAASTASHKLEGSHRKFVRLVVDKVAMTFEGQPTTWDDVSALLEQVPERKNTVLEFAVTSDKITVQQQNEWFGKCIALAHGFGFEYASFIGIHSLGSKGTPASSGDSTGATRLPAFGPVIELTVNSGASSFGRDMYLDLDTSRLMSYPKELKVRSNPHLMFHWLATNGLDLQAVNQAEAWPKAIAEAEDKILFEMSGQHLPTGPLRGIMMCDSAILPLDNAEWDSASPDALTTALATLPANAARFYSAVDELPVTLGFKTREGGMGILQITGFTDDPRGVKIRYKLVQTVSGTNAFAGQGGTDFQTAPVTRGELSQVITATGTLNPLPNDRAKWQINASVDEADIALVEAGQNIVFTVDAFPRRRFTGSVLQISNAPTRMQNAVTYETKLAVNDPDPKFRLGMTAYIAITVAHREAVLRIPNVAFRFRPPGSMSGNWERGPERTVYVLPRGNESSPQLVRIKVGISDGNFAEVTEGLKEGERVVLGMTNPPPANVAVAQAWLSIIDNGRYSESWKNAAVIFQRGVTEEAWINSMKNFREPLGNLVSRKLKSAEETTTLPGAPDGQYVVMQFETSFANKKSAIETVTFLLEKDGKWRAAGYFIK